MSQKENDHRVRVTKMLIRKAFTALIRQKPIQSISIKELCETASINRGTFYSHYTDIYDLQEKMQKSMLSDFQKALEPLLNSKECTPLKITTGVFQCIKDNADICTMTLGPFGDKEFAARLIRVGQEKCLESYSKFYAGASHKQIEFFYAFVSAGCIGLLQKWLLEDRNSSAEEIAKMAEDIMMHGIGFLNIHT